jgi:hypothetical protein
MGKTIIGSILIVCVVSLAACAPSAARPEHDEQAAYYMCKHFATKRLKAPSTAEFPNWYADDGISAARKAAAPDAAGRVGVMPSTYLVHAYVDSQNSFGAMIRTPWDCTIEYIGETNWRLVDLQFEKARR